VHRRLNILPRLVPLRAAFKYATRVGTDGAPEFDNAYHRARYGELRAPVVEGLEEVCGSLPITRELDDKDLNEHLCRAADEMAAAEWPWHDPKAWDEVTRTLLKHIRAALRAKFYRDISDEIRANLRALIPLAEHVLDREDVNLVEWVVAGLGVERIAWLEQREVEEVRRTVKRCQMVIRTFAELMCSGKFFELEQVLDFESWRLLKAWISNKTPEALANATGLSPKEARSRIHAVLQKVVAFANSETEGP
jgi:hypothetical protein